jgi:hypothetical protein
MSARGFGACNRLPLMRQVDGAPYFTVRRQPWWQVLGSTYAGLVEALPALKARVVASGLQDTSLGLESIMQPDDLDYALLEAADDPGGAEIRLGKGAPASTDTKLVLYHYWVGEFPPSAGKAYSTGESCSVYKSLAFPDPAKPALCGLQHGCSSQTGASGSPVIGRGSNQLVGVHYGAGLTRKFNCGLTAEAVRSDLCLGCTAAIARLRQCALETDRRGDEALQGQPR